MEGINIKKRLKQAILAIILILALLSPTFAEELDETLDSNAALEEAAVLEDGVTDELDDEDDDTEVVALFLTDAKKAQAGLGTYRYTLALPTDDVLDEEDPQLAALGVLVRRLIDLDGSLGDPTDAELPLDVQATRDIEYADVYAFVCYNNVLYGLKNGEELFTEEVSTHYTEIDYTKNKKGVPSLRYTRKDGKTVLQPLSHSCVVLFSGEFKYLHFSESVAGEPVAFGAGAMIEKILCDSRIILHNSGLVEEAEYSPAGIRMIGIAYGEDETPVTIDSGMFATGPRPTRGLTCKVCKGMYSSKRVAQVELHTVHECVWPDCMYGGKWSSCAKEGSLYAADLHGPAPWCPYGLCASCSSIRCDSCQRDFNNGTASASQRISYWGRPLILDTDAK